MKTRTTPDPQAEGGPHRDPPREPSDIVREWLGGDTLQARARPGVDAGFAKPKTPLTAYYSAGLPDPDAPP